MLIKFGPKIARREKCEAKALNIPIVSCFLSFNYDYLANRLYIEKSKWK